MENSVAKVVFSAMSAGVDKCVISTIVVLTKITAMYRLHYALISRYVFVRLLR